MAPDELFDRAGPQGPPVDAVDVQFRMPRSLAVYVAELITQDRRHELDAVQRAYERVVADTVRVLQRRVGYVDEPNDFPARALVATAAPARLAITTVIEPTVAGVVGWHPHAHLYVGATATRLPDGARRPTALRHLAQAATTTWADHMQRLRAATEELGLSWDNLGDVPSEPLEVVDPPYADRISDDPPPACPGPWGPRRQVLADTYDFADRDDERGRERATAAGDPG